MLPMAGYDQQAKSLDHVGVAHPICIDYDALSVDSKYHQDPKYVKWCGCISVLILIKFSVLLVLLFTVFHVKDPVLKMNTMKIQGDLDRVSNATLISDTDLTLVADFFVKNPNVGKFKFSNATTTLYHEGVVVGEGGNLLGVAKARRSLRFNVTIDVMVEKIAGDLRLGVLPVSSITSISGRVEMLKIFEKHVLVEMKCSMTVNTTSKMIQDLICDRHASSL